MNTLQIELVYPTEFLLGEKSFLEKIAELRACLESIEGVILVDHVGVPDFRIVLLDHCTEDFMRELDGLLSQGIKSVCFVPRHNQSINSFEVFFKKCARYRGLQGILLYDTITDISKMVARIAGAPVCPGGCKTHEHHHA